MVDGVCEPFMHIIDGFSLLHAKHLIFLNQRVFSSSFDIISSFMSHSKDFPHLACTGANKNYVELIKS